MEDLNAMFKNARQEGLLPHEKEAMRRELQLYIAEHPLRAPFMSRALSSVSSVFSTKTIVFGRFASAALAMLLIVGVGAGTSYAAESALPGDTLYPVKIHVNESVQGALAVSSRAKADWAAERLSRRFQEAEDLAARGNLTAQNAATVQEGLAAVSQDLNVEASALAETKTDAAALPTVRMKIEGILSSHAKALGALVVTHPDATHEIEPILALAKVADETSAGGADTSGAQGAAEAAFAEQNAESKNKEAGTPHAFAAHAVSTLAATTTPEAPHQASTANESGAEAAPPEQSAPTHQGFAVHKDQSEGEDLNLHAILQLRHALSVVALDASSTSSNQEEATINTSAEASSTIEMHGNNREGESDH